jgi:protein ImuA
LQIEYSIAFPHRKRDMEQSAAFSALRNHAAVAAELRRLLPKMEGVKPVRPSPFGLTAIDRCLPQGGLSGAALHEIVPDEGSTPAAFGFLIALLVHASSAPSLGERNRTDQSSPLILVMPDHGLRDYGRPYSHGLNALGLDPRRLLLVETAHRKDALWATEEALRSGAPSVVAGVIDQFDLKTSQRLQLAAMDAGLPLFVLRSPRFLESSAASTRWRVAAATAARDRFGLFARSRWQLTLERCRNGRTGEWMVEYDHVAHRFSLAAALADPALSRRTS